ncbi:MAG: glycosyltransferase [Actinobacteria bacterium]|nr:glycosyltransferase [Actinomycetota bacterium]
MIFSGILLVLPSLLALITVSNQFFLHKIKENEIVVSDSVAVLVPVRNEESNVRDLIYSLKNQMGLEKLRVILINDNSTDQTVQLIRETIFEENHFLLVEGEPLPEGWLGKPFALHQGFQKSESDLLVLIDADVRLKPYAIAQAVALLQKRNLDFLSAYPQEIARTWSERLIQPLLQWSWMATVPLRIGERSSNPAFAIANGQFLLLRRDSLASVGEFKSIQHEVIDDIALARVLIRNGFRGTVADGSLVANCRMYKSWGELRDGYGKSLPVAFGGLSGTSLVASLLFITGVLPFISAGTGSIAGLSASLLIYFSRLLSARATGGRLVDVLFHPFSSILLIFLMARAWRKRGSVQWKGRTV